MPESVFSSSALLLFAFLNHEKVLLKEKNGFFF